MTQCTDGVRQVYGSIDTRIDVQCRCTTGLYGGYHGLTVYGRSTAVYGRSTAVYGRCTEGCTAGVYGTTYLTVLVGTVRQVYGTLRYLTVLYGRSTVPYGTVRYGTVKIRYR